MKTISITAFILALILISMLSISALAESRSQIDAPFSGRQTFGMNGDRKGQHQYERNGEVPQSDGR